ncbi:MAG: FxsA family protein [Rhodospirillaceae bacterium]
MRLVFLTIVLIFPFLDLYVTARFARWTGVPIWFWLVSSAVAGMWLMRTERVEFRARTVAAMHGEYPLLRGLVDSGRKVAAALLFILPGVLSDVLGLLLLLLPINQRGGFGPEPVTAGRSRYRPSETLEGDWRRE